MYTHDQLKTQVEAFINKKAVKPFNKAIDEIAFIVDRWGKNFIDLKMTWGTASVLGIDRTPRYMKVTPKEVADFERGKFLKTSDVSTVLLSTKEFMPEFLWNDTASEKKPWTKVRVDFVRSKNDFKEALAQLDLLAEAYRETRFGKTFYVHPENTGATIYLAA